jgi:asparagine synthase (glutamine-hydrolysing)
MCGFVGIMSQRGVSRLELIKARDEVTHRGPDDQGLYLSKDNCLGLGFRRLSIIDLSLQGHQPMANEDGTLWIVFNGEIYNYTELREELECRGHNFKSNTDTETILHGFEEWGAEVVDHLRGMFAFAIWNENQKCLFLSTDPIGIKPLYYYQRNGTFAFASELKSLLKFSSISRELDLNALNQYLAFGYIPSEESIFRDIRKLAPGHFLRYRHDGSIEKSRYFEASFLSVTNSEREEDLVDRLYELLKDSVKRALQSDVPIGVFLSGGLDSSVLATIAASYASRPIQTFSIGFKEDRYNELPYARKIAESISSEHHEFYVTFDSLEALDRISDQYDEPFADSSAVPTYYVSKMAAQHVKVAISGDGGDELFGGYNWYSWVINAQRMKQALWPLASPISFVSEYLPFRVKGKKFLSTIRKDAVTQLIDRTFIFRGSERATILKEDVRANIQLLLPEARIKKVFDSGSKELIGRMQSVDLNYYLPYDGLVKVDRASMMSSVEVRPPYLDKDLIKFALSLPEKYKIRGSKKKYLQKKLALRILPSGFPLERKQGFCIPVREWFQGHLSEVLADAMRGQYVQMYLNTHYLKHLLWTHKKGQQDNSSKLWSALMFSLWARKYL